MGSVRIGAPGEEQYASPAANIATSHESAPRFAAAEPTHLPAPPRRGAELTLSATPSSAAAASSRVNSSTSIRREKLKGLGPEPPREARTSPGRRNGEAPPSRSTSGTGNASGASKTGTSLPSSVSFLPSPLSFPRSFPLLYPLPQTRDLRLLPHHVTHGHPTGTRSRAPAFRPFSSPRLFRGARMRAGAGSWAAGPAAASCPPAESWDWAWEAGFALVPPPDGSAPTRC
ncbi:uncharacterized protein LOC110595931 [Carlito syrichta]|uniref:Uncharacterized protein LOC110595931 n=1 Tax=Carlito syrichta TaxID=1868482 RepID=A0A3Q0E2U9_CARSF|nr:uncharacterized protein LOC110595931 [Carlito syrichta]